MLWEISTTLSSLRIFAQHESVCVLRSGWGGVCVCVCEKGGVGWGWRGSDLTVSSWRLCSSVWAQEFQFHRNFRLQYSDFYQLREEMQPLRVNRGPWRLCFCRLIISRCGRAHRQNAEQRPHHCLLDTGEMAFSKHVALSHNARNPLIFNERVPVYSLPVLTV